ncbi:unnamed protein product [Mytilus edulis]|uniref:DNA-directed DNA polymerase n=1 Tax=Mytilus edulis TaxID=6550 RepID=A0A8S3QS61_MYTED|nr:unnamed protein product [Mytilus edulis]
MNSMNVEDRHDFLKWYKEKKSKGAISDFAKEIEACCRVDVTILRKACLKFRELILTQTNYEVDAFDSVTIASMCMTIFRTCFLQEEHRVHLVTNTDLALQTRWVNGHGKAAGGTGVSLYAERTGQDQTSGDEADDDSVLPDQIKADHQNAGYKYVSIWEHDFQSKLKKTNK